MISLDTSVFMDILSGIPGIVNKASHYIEESKKEGAVISSCVLAEVVFHVSKRRGLGESAEAVSFIESFPGISIIDTTAEIAVLATAIVCKADKFITTDPDFAGISEIKTVIYR